MRPKLPPIFILFVLMVVLSCGRKQKKLVERQSLNCGWQLTEKGLNRWIPANVPGNVHSDLFQNQKIADPYKDCNANQLDWIDKTDWEYCTRFDVNSNVFHRENVDLVFEGLDTYATIWLNDTLVDSVNNMFRTWRFDVKPLLKPKNNQLKIVFGSTAQKNYLDSIQSKLAYPGDKRVFSRKAAYQFGWDWAPSLPAVGIWKPVYLEGFDQYFVTAPHIRTQKISEWQADMQAEVTIRSHRATKANISILNAKTNEKYVSAPIEITPGKKLYRCNFIIKNPKLWWCNGLGEPNLYEIKMVISFNSGELWDTTLYTGIRDLKVVSVPDSIGKNLLVTLNNVPVFVKGANYVPQHSFPTEVSDSQYINLLSTVKNCHFNMLRVWGGGIYEKDLFYTLCDRFGILVWQDFMFACAMYPFDSAFIDNVSAEASEQIQRLRNHPSLAVWCGNNEINEGWYNWGWQKKFKLSTNDSTQLYTGYKNLFEHLLPALVDSLDNARFYLSTTPTYGWGRKESLTHGTAHYWGVWWGLKPFENYLYKVPRFMNEFGFQSMPAQHNISKFLSQNPDWITSQSLRCHEKHPTGFETISTYLNYENLYPSSLESFIFLSRLIQAEGVGMAIEAHRAAKPYCTGTLYWQLNDCWPAVSWSSIDFWSDKKPLLYKVKKLYANLLPAILPYSDSLVFYLISDNLKPLTGNYSIQLYRFDGTKRTLLSKSYTIAANSSTKIFSLKRKDLETNINPREYLVEAVFETAGEKYVNRKFLAKVGDLLLPKPKLQYRLTETMGGYLLEINALSTIAFLDLSIPQKKVSLSDNHYTLLPNETKIITITTPDKITERDLVLQSLNQHIEIK